MTCSKRCVFTSLFLFVSVFLWATPLVRIKEIATIGGIRENQLLGIGLVTGLAGRGDSSNSQLLKDAIANLAAHFGFDISSKDVRSRNCAVVTVSATVPAFMRVGDRIDVIVSSIGDARSLEGGILLQTPLRAAKDDIYAVAQGTVIVPSERSAAKTVGTITSGAIAEQEVISTFVTGNTITIILREPDFVTATAVREAITAKYADLAVSVRDSSLIEIAVPESRKGDVVKFIAEIESVTVTPDASSKVVIDAKNGVIIMGERVKIAKVVVSYKSTSVSVGSFYYGDTTGQKEQFVIEETVTVEDFVKTVREIGLSTETIIEILKAIDIAGALYGTLIIN